MCDQADEAIRISNLSVDFRKQSPAKRAGTEGSYFPVVRLPSLSIQQGTIVAILGPSGCGKTTFLKVIAGLHDPCGKNVRLTGDIKLLGKSVTEAVRSHLLSISFQVPVLMPWRTSSENIMLPLELTGQMAKMGVEQLEQNRYDIDQALKTVRLPGFQDRYPEELSSGQLSRVAVAQAMMSQAKILLMDEVFGTLDEANRMEMNLRLRKINCSLMHRTVVFVTHSVEEAVLLGDRVLVFQRLECQVRPESSVVKDISIALSERSNEVRYSDSDFHKQKQDLEETLLSLEA